ncbi:hypothetical protein Tco_1256441 [Tanacetum coccineum]
MDPLTFNDLMATPIDFSKYVLNGLKIENLTQDILLGPTFNLLKGTCSSSIELEYNFYECFNALTNKLDWNNPELDCYPFDLSKPLPLQGPLEGDFVDLHLNDIEDMLLLAIQHILFHLDGSVIVDFIVALCKFTRILILKRCVEDLHPSVEKKLNIAKPQKTFLEIEFKEPYTASYNPLGIVYEDLDKQKRVFRDDELYKFSDGTLKSVHDEIHHKVLNFCLDYNTKMPKRK